MTPRDRFIAALERRPLPGLVPHFELVFFLTMEALGKVHPSHRNYHQWHQMSAEEKKAHRLDLAHLYIDSARMFGHSAIFLHPHELPHDENLDEIKRTIDLVRDLTGDEFFLMLHGDGSPAIPSGGDMEELCCQMAEEPDEFEEEVDREVDRFLGLATKLADHGGLDGFGLCSDYCFNEGPFLSPAWFKRFVTPYLHKQIAGYRDLGFYVIKHTDGNILPILDDLIECNPHAIHSLDPQGQVDIAEIVRLAGDKLCLCGNVNSGLLQTGTDEECIESARYALHEGMKAPGYIYATSNCVYTGMPLKRYELMLDVWRKEGIRPDDVTTAI